MMHPFSDIFLVAMAIFKAMEGLDAYEKTSRFMSALLAQDYRVPPSLAQLNTKTLQIH